MEDKGASVIDENDMFNLAEAPNKQPFEEMLPYVEEFAPQFQPLWQNLLSYKDVKRLDISALYDVLIEVNMPFLSKDGFADPKMGRLDELMYQIGMQL